MKYFLIAGEASGDLLGSLLMQSIKKLDNDADFCYWGGDLMKIEGGKLKKHIRELAIMGFVEVLLKLFVILKNFKQIKNDLIDYKPDALILVDYPGFNLRVAKIANKLGLKVFYYVSPTVWAWHESRVKIIKKYVDTMFVILPFEKEFYKKHSYNVFYEGHPVIDSINLQKDKNVNVQSFFLDNSLETKPIIALLPGSRLQELRRILPVMLPLIKYYPDYQFIIAGVSSLPQSEYENLIADFPVKVVFDSSPLIMQIADIALVTSGTATLETALYNTPEVVCYKTSRFTFFIAKMLIKIKYISLVNLIMEKEIVKELIQDNFTTKNLKVELDNLITDNIYRATMKDNFTQLHKKLGGGGASNRIAKRIVKSTKL